MQAGGWLKVHSINNYRNGITYNHQEQFLFLFRTCPVFAQSFTEQIIEGSLPRVRFSMREVSRSEMTVVDGHYVQEGEELWRNHKTSFPLIKVPF